MRLHPLLPAKKTTAPGVYYVKDVLPANDTRLPVVPQILNKTAQDFRILANYLYDMVTEPSTGIWNTLDKMLQCSNLWYAIK